MNSCSVSGVDEEGIDEYGDNDGDGDDDDDGDDEDEDANMKRSP